MKHVCLVLGFTVVLGQVIEIPLNHHERRRPLRDQFWSVPQGLNSKNLPMNNIAESVYTSDLMIGTPYQPFRVLVDTGSADTWVFSVANRKPFELPSLFESYNHSKSSTYTPVGSKFLIHYGTGQASGFSAQDVVALGGVQSKSKMTFAEIDGPYQETNIPLGYPQDGIMGFGFPAYSVLRSPNPLQVLKNDGLVPKAVATFSLARTGASSSLLLGDLPILASNEEIIWVPVVPFESSWIIEIKSLSAGGCQECILTACKALIDSGSTFMSFPKYTFQHLTSNIRGSRTDCGLAPQGFWKCSKLNPDGLIPLSFEVNGRTLTLEGKDFMRGGTEANGAGVLELSQFDDPVFILGQPFMRKYTSIFDFDNERIGFVVKK